MTILLIPLGVLVLILLLGRRPNYLDGSNLTTFRSARRDFMDDARFTFVAMLALYLFKIWWRS